MAVLEKHGFRGTSKSDNGKTWGISTNHSTLTFFFSFLWVWDSGDRWLQSLTCRVKGAKKGWREVPSSATVLGLFGEERPLACAPQSCLCGWTGCTTILKDEPMLCAPHLSFQSLLLLCAACPFPWWPFRTGTPLQFLGDISKPLYR